MAYRFLLEVPKTLSDDANAAIGASGVAQVLVARPSHGLGIDDEYQDLTIAARNLTVVDDLYGWYDDLQAGRPESRTSITIVLHDGRRFGLHQADPAQTIAAIRRDQPWVERSIPKIGEHERDRFAAGRGTSTVDAADIPSAATETVSREVAVVEGGLTDPESRISRVQVHLSEGTVEAHGGTFLRIAVMDLAGPEHFYHDVLGMTLLGRTRVLDDGQTVDLPAEYDHFTAGQTNTEADFAYMAHGPVQIALQRIGRAYPMEYGTIVNDFTLRVEPALAHKIKAQVLMRGYTLLEQSSIAFTFRDPYGVAWQIVPAA